MLNHELPSPVGGFLTGFPYQLNLKPAVHGFNWIFKPKKLKICCFIILKNKNLLFCTLIGFLDLKTQQI